VAEQRTSLLPAPGRQKSIDLEKAVLQLHIDEGISLKSVSQILGYSYSQTKL